MPKLDDILRDVTPPEKLFIAGNGLTTKERFYAQRAVRNFAPLVRALEFYANNGDGGGGEKYAKAVLAEALKP